MIKINGINLYKYILVFIIMSILGYFYETILEIIENLIKYQKIIFTHHTAVIYGYMNVIYGLGANIIMLLFMNKNKSLLTIFIQSSLILGLFEFLVSFIQEGIIGYISWDYSDKFLNIGGRTTIPYMLVWGISTIIFIKYIYPFLEKVIDKIPYKLILSYTLLIILLLDNVFTWIILYRRNERINGIESNSRYDKIIDSVYNNNYLDEKFPLIK